MPNFLSSNLGELRDSLADGIMQFGRYSFFTVHDPKIRNICAATFEKRVAHHALIPIF